MINSTHLFFQEILDKDRQKLLPKLKFFKNLGFYLAGGTALALQYGHRKSIDFDFFIKKDIDTKILFENILEEFDNDNILKTYQEKNTLYIEINGIKISFMTYKYSLLNDLIETDFLNIASDIDISTMKLWAIQNRATNKDYVDLYFLLQKFSLDKLISFFYKRFGNIVNENLILKSLVYFDDIQTEKLKMIKKIDFNDIKRFLKETIIKREGNNFEK